MSVVHFSLFYDSFSLIEFLNINCLIECQTVATIAEQRSTNNHFSKISIFEQIQSIYVCVYIETKCDDDAAFRITPVYFYVLNIRTK